MRAAVVAVLAGVTLLVACAAEQKRFGAPDDDAPEFSARRLGEPSSFLIETLSPEERLALERIGVDVTLPPPDVDDSLAAEEEGTTMEKAGRATMSMLVVGITLGAMAAPYLLF